MNVHGVYNGKCGLRSMQHTFYKFPEDFGVGDLWKVHSKSTSQCSSNDDSSVGDGFKGFEFEIGNEMGNYLDVP
ncbi:hypothetical protein SESBI_50348, partial [Sesbania bispinosa]